MSNREVVVKPNTKAPPAKVDRIKSIRDSHHMAARLYALGTHSPGEIAAMTGYSNSYLSVLRKDQAFSELVDHYRGMVDDQMMASTDTYFQLAELARTKSMRMINDKLDDPACDLSVRELVTIHADTADRTGYGKRSTQVNVNVDFASRLDQAIARSQKAKVIDQPAAPPSLADAVDGGGGASGEGLPPPSIPNLRRAG